MCVLLAAFDILRKKEGLGFEVSLTRMQSFAWLTTAGLLGVLLAVPLRRHYIVDEKLPFADGLAAGETVLICDSQGPTAVRAALAMMAGMALSALLMALTEDARIVPRGAPVVGSWLPFSSTLLLGTATMKLMGFGVEWSLLAVGSGMLVGLRINLSMLLGTVLSWVIAPYLLSHYNLLPAKFTRTDVLFWVMWPATGMMVAGGLAALVLRWRALVRTFTRSPLVRSISAGDAAAPRGLQPQPGATAIAATHSQMVGTEGQSARQPQSTAIAATPGQSVTASVPASNPASDEFPLRWVLVGVVLTGAALVIVQKTMLDQAVWITVAAIVLSLPLALVGLRVLGETNWGPISALSNMMQGVFALLAPGNVPANMVASGTTGTIAIESEAIMQDYKAGDMVGSSPRLLTYMQLLATPVGAAAVSWMYPFLADYYGIGPGGLNSPISVKWAGFAEILSRGFGALPPGALTALLVAAALGVVLATLEAVLKNKTFVPSPTGLGIGMLVPASVIVTMAYGGFLGWVWSKASRRTSEQYMTPLASGLIAGEALIAIVVPLLVVSGVLKA
jgi:OPT family oligopeptide transporter